MRREDSAKCTHRRSEVIVTNQPDGYDNTRSHASTWVCSDPGCVIDAMGWVVRFTKEKAWWRPGVTGEWHDEQPGVTS